VTSVSSADGSAPLAAEAIASAYGVNLATQTQQAAVIPLPINLGGTSVMVTDANGISRSAELFYASSTQVNYEVPPGVAAGTAKVTVSVNGDPVAFGTARIAAITPGLYTATSDGKGVAAAVVVTVHANTTQSLASTFQCSASGCAAVPIDLGLDSDVVVLELFGTGIRGRSAVTNVTCKIGSTTLPVAYAGPQTVFVGLDQVNVTLPKSLRGSGTQTVLLTVDGQTANAVSLTFK